MGELLKVSLSKFRRGQGTVKVVDYYAEGQPEIEIEIAKDKTPLENMEKYFKRARKLRAGRPRIESEMERTGEEISLLESLRSSVAEIPEPGDMSEIAGRVEKALAPKKPKKRKGVPQAKLGPRRFVSSQDYEILVGRNQRQNDRLTLTIARGTDLFMHSSGASGSHVIVRTGGRGTAPRQTMLEAANLAIYYSKMRNNRYAEVSWTRVKHVSKPRGAKPGLVYLSKHKVLGIEPDEELVKMLHENAREL
jgi:predicted ribosome quality control (RQC) complex YloA/Tae2 family protein